MLQYAVSGLIYGGAYALLGLCVVLMFRMVRVLNFAQGAIGASGAYIAVALSAAGWSYGPAIAVGAVSAAAIAVICGAVISRWFADAGTEIRSAVTIGMLIALLALGTHIIGTRVERFPQLFPSSVVDLGGVVTPIASIALVVATVLIALGIAVFLRRTRVGIRLRAQSERPTTAELLTVPARSLSVLVWGVTGALSAIGIFMVAPSRASDFTSLALLVVPATAAAAVGLFRSTGLAVVGGVVLGLIAGLAEQDPSLAQYSDALPLLVIVAVLIWTQRAQVWDATR
jgi:branched-chain amino acid transport system permease protein